MEIDQMSFDESTDRFATWFKSLPAASISPLIEIVDLRDRGAGRGIIAKQDIPPDTELFRIPREAIMSVETSNLRELVPGVFDEQQNDSLDGEMSSSLNSWDGLILVMLYEFFRGSESPWFEYFAVLPTEFETPMFWSDAELDELQASHTRSKIGKEEATGMFQSTMVPIIRKYEDVFAGSRDLNDQQLIEMAHRMGSTIMAYAFDLENEDEEVDNAEDGWVEDKDDKSLMGMVPMADILNADAEFNAHINHGDDSLTATAISPIIAGEEILNYYGPHPNSELLRRYGYITQKHSRYDVVEIPWITVETAAKERLGLSDAQLDTARQVEPDEDFEDTFILERDTGEPNSEGKLPDITAVVSEIPQDMRERLRSFLTRVRKAGLDTTNNKRKRNEISLDIMDQALQTIESSYLTSIEHDIQLLGEGSSISLRHNMAIHVRLGEKRLVREARERLAEAAHQESGDQDRETHQRRIR